LKLDRRTRGRIIFWREREREREREEKREKRREERREKRSKLKRMKTIEFN